MTMLKKNFQKTFILITNEKKEKKEKKEKISNDIAFVIWDEYTIKNKRLAKAKEIIIVDKYGSINIGSLQDRYKNKWSKNKLSENDKKKLLSNVYFQNWIDKKK